MYIHMIAQKQTQQLRDTSRIIETEYLVTSLQQKWFQDKHLKDHQKSNREDDRRRGIYWNRFVETTEESNYISFSGDT